MENDAAHEVDAPARDADDSLDEADLCISCLAVLDDGCSQCRRCAAPVGPTAAMAPFERIFAEGFIYRRAISEPASLIVVAGVCAVFALLAFAGFVCVVWDLVFAPMAGALLLTGWFNLIVGTAGIWQCIKNYRKREVPAEERIGQ